MTKQTSRGTSWGSPTAVDRSSRTAAELSKPSTIDKGRPLNAAVLPADDPRASTALKIIPPKARKVKVGKADMGYWHDSNAATKAEGRNFDLGLARMREIESIIKHVFGSCMPDPRGTDDYDLCVAYIRQIAFCMAGQDMRAWCQKWAPWADTDLINRIEAEVGKRSSKTSRMTKADICGRDIALTWALRCKLGIKTISASDLTAAEQKQASAERKRERDRTRQERNRKLERRKDRKSYEANSLSKQKPWEALNMTRATWYRKDKPMNETSVSRVLYKDMKGDRPVSKQQECAQPLPSSDLSSSQKNHPSQLSDTLRGGMRDAGEHKSRVLPLDPISPHSADLNDTTTLIKKAC